MLTKQPTKRTLIQLAVIVILYLLLRAPLAGKALWHDEIYGTRSYLSTSPLLEFQQEKKALADFSWGTDWKRQMKIHPPLWYVFYYCWVRLFGDSEVSLHIPVMLIGLMGIVLLYAFSSLIFENDISFPATLATVFSASHIMYSAQVVHAVFELLIFLVSLILLYKFIITGNPRKFRLLLIANVLGVCIFYHYLLYLFVQNAILWALRSRLKIRPLYFIIVFLFLISFYSFFALNYVKNRYADFRHWPENTPEQTRMNIVFLPINFTLW